MGIALKDQLYKRSTPTKDQLYKRLTNTKDQLYKKNNARRSKAANGLSLYLYLSN